MNPETTTVDARTLAARVRAQYIACARNCMRTAPNRLLARWGAALSAPDRAALLRRFRYFVPLLQGDAAARRVRHLERDDARAFLLDDDRCADRDGPRFYGLDNLPRNPYSTGPRRYELLDALQCVRWDAARCLHALLNSARFAEFLSQGPNYLDTFAGSVHLRLFVDALSFGHIGSAREMEPRIVLIVHSRMCDIMAAAARGGSLACVRLAEALCVRLRKVVNLVEFIWDTPLQLFPFAVCRILLEPRGSTDDAWMASTRIFRSAAQEARAATMRYLLRREPSCHALKDYLQSANYALFRLNGESIARSGCLKCLALLLDFARDHALFWREEGRENEMMACICATAARNGQLDVLVELRARGSVDVFDAHVIAEAAARGSLPCMQFAFEHGGAMGIYALRNAAKHGHVDCLAYAVHALGLPCDRLGGKNEWTELLRCADARCRAWLLERASAAAAPSGKGPRRGALF